MLDLKYVRENLVETARLLKTRNFEFNTAEFKKLEEDRRALIFKAENLKAEKNAMSKQIGELKKNKQDATAVMEKVKVLGEETSAAEAQAAEVDESLQKLLQTVPNLPAAGVPEGGEENNKVVDSWGEPKKFDFEAKAHWDLGESLGILDWERAAKITGSRFTVYKGLGARLERALVQFMLDVQTQEHGYEEYWLPLMVNSKSMYGTGQLPKFEQDLFKLRDTDYYLIPTAEVPLTNYRGDEVLELGELPLKMTAYTPCFRSEAGAYGKDTKGMVRQHQFNKVELVKVTTPESSEEEHEKLTADAEEVLKKLGLAYRKLLLSTGDMGFGARKCYDLEVWAPGADRWYECSSCSNFGDFQARRANLKYKDAEGKRQFCHTINGSGLATSRIFPAILENYQNADGSVTIPEVLRPYLGGLEKLEPKA